MITVAGGFRCGLLDAIGDGRKRAGHRFLIGPRSPAHRDGRRVARASVLHDFGRDLANRKNAHENDQRFRLPDLAPIDAVHIVAGDEGHHLGVGAMRERNAAVGRDAQRRSHARHHFERNAGVGQALPVLRRRVRR